MEVDIVEKILAIFLTGISIKLMDDYLDQEVDKLDNKETVALKWERAVLPYGLLALSLATALHRDWALSLFWASYILGMGYDPTRKLPTQLAAYQESLILLGLGVYLLPVPELISALLIIALVQLVDDLIDYRYSGENLRNNLAHRLDKSQVIISIIFITLAVFHLDLVKGLLTFLLTPIVVKLLEGQGVVSSVN
ncbi:MAG: hypothetical protein ACQEQI_00430 [Bacillota bacterium]